MTPALLLDIAIAYSAHVGSAGSAGACFATFSYSEITTPKTPNLIAENAHSARLPLFSSPSQWNSIRVDALPQSPRP